MSNRSGRDDTIVILALLLLREMLAFSGYPVELQREISKRATELIEYMQQGYPRDEPQTPT